jgi:TonB family protein
MTSALPPHARGVGIAGTTVAHGALIALAIWAAHRSTAVHGMVYEVSLVAAPLPSAGSKTATAPAPAAKAKPVPPPAKSKAAKPAPKPVPAKPVATPPAVKTPPVLAQHEAPGTGTDPVTLHQAGLQFPFPDYLKNIESSVYRRWNHSQFRPGFEVRIAFVISKDGSVADASYIVEKSSGNSAFDEAARTALESVVAHREFGPLPDGFNGASLPILFVFTQVRAGAP